MNSGPQGRVKVVVMGVSGSGKTTLGRLLAGALQAEFLDADDFHTPQAKAEMARGQALTDAERAPWLARLASALRSRERAVLACSALKREYRDVLRVGGVHFIFLDVPESLLRARLSQRRGHYAGVNLLASQLSTLEAPQPDETDLTTLAVGAHDAPGALLTRALKELP